MSGASAKTEKAVGIVEKALEMLPVGDERIVLNPRGLRLLRDALSAARAELDVAVTDPIVISNLKWVLETRTAHQGGDGHSLHEPGRCTVCKLIAALSSGRERGSE